MGSSCVGSTTSGDTGGSYLITATAATAQQVAGSNGQPGGNVKRANDASGHDLNHHTETLLRCSDELY